MASESKKPERSWDVDAAAQIIAALKPLSREKQLHTLAVVMKVFIELQLPQGK